MGAQWSRGPPRRQERRGKDSLCKLNYLAVWLCLNLLLVRLINCFLTAFMCFSMPRLWLSPCQKERKVNFLVIYLILVVSFTQIILLFLFVQGEAFAREHGLIFMETSAKTAANVEEVRMFQFIIWLIDKTI